MAKDSSENQGRVSVNFTKQYPVDSLNAQRYKALKEYYGGDLKKLVEQALWVVLGPLGSALAGKPSDAIEQQLKASKTLFDSLQFEAKDLGGLSSGVATEMPSQNGNPEVNAPINASTKTYELNPSTPTDETEEVEDDGGGIDSLFD